MSDSHPLDLSSDDMADYLRMYIDETGEHLDALVETLLALEADPDDAAGLNEAFRLIHSISSAPQDRLEPGEVGTIGECFARRLQVDEISLRRQTGEDQFDLHFRKREPGAQGDGDAPMPRVRRRGRRLGGARRLRRRGRVGQGGRSGRLRDLVAARAR